MKPLPKTSLVALLILAVAAALRVQNLALRPFHHDEGVNGFFLARLDGEGLPDASFDGNGVARYEFDRATNGDDHALALTLSGGKPVGAGVADNIDWVVVAPVDPELLHLRRRLRGWAHPALVGEHALVWSLRGRLSGVEPAAAELLRRDAREVGLEIDDRRTVEHVDAAHR